ncbi:MAG TPA: hypothetical protein VJ654_01165 [Noviherbaspirillum sp.]|nr:hypothetical protein [Noviherbaspirillum sp.]
MLIKTLCRLADIFTRRKNPEAAGEVAFRSYLQRHGVDASKIPDAAIRELAQDAFQKRRLLCAGSHHPPEKTYMELLELYAYQVRQLLRNPRCLPSEYQYYTSTRLVLEKHGLKIVAEKLHRKNV